jgi:UDP-N-acetylmuramoyl-tripeptide--D-alanyl-D-alanine ligase
MAAAAAAMEMGMGIEEIDGRIHTLRLPKKRCERIEKNGVTFVSDCYNASGDSTVAALDVVSESPKRRVGVLGSMMELGPVSDREHQRVGEHALGCLDALLCLGKETGPVADVWRKAGRPVEHFVDREKLIDRMGEFLEKGDTVLVKGSNSLRMWELIELWEGR